jgi:hypothetical protein
MANTKYTLIGKSLDDSALQQFPPEAKFAIAQTSEWRAMEPADLIQDDSLHHLDRLSTLMMSAIHLKCPVGPHDDPGLSIAVIRACNIAKAGSVAIQCSLGHWAEYPCG